MQLPKVIFLDWYKTLSNSVFWEHLIEEDPATYKQIQKSFLRTHKNLIDPWMRGKFSTEEIVSKIAKDTKLGETFLIQNLVESVKEMRFAEEGIQDLFGNLRLGGIKVYIATDNMDTFTRWTTPHLGLDKIFDGILNSWELRALKGDFDKNQSLFFNNFFKNNELNPSDCVLIDDNVDNENLISDFGINYIKINSTSEVTQILRSII